MDICSESNSNAPRLRAGGLALLCALMLLTVAGCRDKTPSDSEPSVAPPLGLVFSLPSGMLSYFDLNALSVVHRDTLEGTAVVSATVAPVVDRMLLADGASNRLMLVTLPDFGVLVSARVGGAPLDVGMDSQMRNLYTITMNGNLWRYSPAAARFDTLELHLHPRCMAVRPPEAAQAWIVSTGQNLVQIVNLTALHVQDSVLLGQLASDATFVGDGQTALVALYAQPGVAPGQVVLFDADTRVQTDILETDEAGVGPFELAVSDDDRLLAAADSVSGRLYIWDLSTRARWTVNAGHAPSTVCWARNTHTCYVLAAGDNRVLRYAVESSGPARPDTLDVGDAASYLVLWEAAY